MQALIALGGALAVSSSVLAAQQAPPTEESRRDSAQRLESAVVTGRRTSTVVGGASVLVVRPDSLRLAPGANLDELMRAIPLMLVRQNSRGEVELSPRGAESRQVGILMDGLPLSYGWDGRADASLVPLSGVSTVTYTRGLGTLLAGPNTLGGVVELRLDEPVTGGGWQSQLVLGSDQTGARQTSLGTATTRTLAGGRQLTVRAGGSYRQRDGYSRASGVTDVRPDQTLRVGTDLEQYDGFAHASMRLGQGASLAATFTAYDASRGVAPELHVESPRYWRYPDANRSALMLKGTAPNITSRAGLTQIEGSVGRVAGKSLIEQFGSAMYDEVTGTEAGDETSYSGRVQVRQTLPSGVQVTAAATSSRMRYLETLNTDAASTYRQELGSAGLEATWPVNGRLVLGGGVVSDWASTPEAGGRPLQDNQQSTGWRLGGTTEISPRVRLHASASQRARFPALRELYSGALNRFEPNPDLVPERLLITEVGVTFGARANAPGWSLQTTGFRQQLADGIVRISLPDRKFKRVNQNEQVSLGVESLMGWRGGLNQPSLLLELVAQRVRVEDVTSSDGPLKPEHQPGLRAGLDGLLPLGNGFQAGTNVVHIGSQYCVHPDRDTNVTLGAQTAAGVTLERSWTLPGLKAFRFLRVLGAVDNVTDNAMYEQCGLPRAGRTFRLSLSLH